MLEAGKNRDGLVLKACWLARLASPVSSRFSERPHSPWLREQHRRAGKKEHESRRVGRGMSSAHDMTVTHRGSQGLTAALVTCVRSSQTKVGRGGTDYFQAPPLTEEPLAVDSCWGRAKGPFLRVSCSRGCSTPRHIM